ncbi:hypothetical protein C2845_PM02G13040 [Panicum miliaceum]|uniref:BTB/POZ and MATH domain-containing protein 2-like n=1 Tax=Panicum miliaceum TaxID=4540 RepID=A0A3L6S6P5_PANMI|nr:hypothetical protein C2845_PM02G13040 [Panicum miliaceum]
MVRPIRRMPALNAGVPGGPACQRLHKTLPFPLPLLPSLCPHPSVVSSPKNSRAQRRQNPRRHSTSHMPPPESATGDLSGTLSASAIVGGTVTGHHLLHIDCYSQTKAELPTGQCIKSCPFSAGGRSWRISYFPNANKSSAAEYISVLVYLDHSVAQPVKARVRISLLGQAGEPVPSHSKITEVHDFCTASSDFGYSEFIKRAWLEESEHLKVDRFTIRCDVIVITKELSAEERRPQFPLVVVPPSNLHQNLGDLLASKEGADVAFLVAGETFKAHKCVLAARSAVFKAEVFGAMKESTNGALIRVDDMDAQGEEPPTDEEGFSR